MVVFSLNEILQCKSAAVGSGYVRVESWTMYREDKVGKMSS